MEDYPSLPVQRNRSKLEDGLSGDGEGGSQLKTFLRMLLRNNAEWVESEHYKPYCSRLPTPKLYPSLLQLPAGFALNCRPSSTNCGCKQRTLRELSLSGEHEVLSISAQEVGAFGESPLQELGVEMHLHRTPVEARPSLIPSLCTHFTRAGIEWRR